MASANEWAAKGKKYSKMAKEGADKLAAFQKESEKLQKAGATLNQFQEVAVGLKWASKLSVGLGAVSMGFTVVAALLPVPSTEDQILEGVQRIEDQIDSLSGHIDTLIDELDGKRAEDLRKTLLQVTHESVVKTASYKLASIAERRSGRVSGDPGEYEEQLLDLEGGIDIALTAIEAMVTDPDPKSNVLRLTADNAFGDPRWVIPTAMHLQNIATTAVVAYSAQRLIKRRKAIRAKEGREMTEHEVVAFLENIGGHPEAPSDMSAQLNRVVDAVQAELKRCLSRSARIDYMETYYKNHIKEFARGVMADRQGGADFIQTQFSLRFPYMNFTAIVYDGVADEGKARRHGWVGSTHGDYGVIADKRVPLVGKKDSDDADEKRNILIYHCPRYLKETPLRQRLGTLKAPSPTRKAIANQMSTLLNSFKHGGLHTQWKKVRYEGEALWKFIQSLYTANVWGGSHDWENDFVWIGYTEAEQSELTANSNINAKLSHAQKEKLAQETMKDFIGISATSSIGLLSRFDPGEYTYDETGHEYHQVDARYYQVVVLWQRVP